MTPASNGHDADHLDADYVVKGCGAFAMAFVDTMLRESDATMIVVDRREAPGGHWNDAYPFVRLHQPSACYGVASRELGSMRKDEVGPNAGCYELASGMEVVNYYHQLMRDCFLPTGRVRYFAMSELVGDHEIVSLLSGERRAVRANCRVVDATLLETSIPLTHTRKFEVADGVACIPPNELPRAAPRHTAFVVLGAGKTAIDSLSWLLANGAPPEAIHWVMPRDPWLFNRRMFQPGEDMFVESMSRFAEMSEITATAESAREIGERMEAAGNWLRIDPGVWPQLFRAATVSEGEVAELRKIGHKIRMGRVQRVEPGRLMLDRGTEPIPADALIVDCTARALERDVGAHPPVFAPGRINLQMVRIYQPTFSGALIAHLEATISNDAEKEAMCRVTGMTDSLEDWMSVESASRANQAAWDANPQVADWITNCRLDLFQGTGARVVPTDQQALAAVMRQQAASGPGADNMVRLLARA